MKIDYIISRRDDKTDVVLIQGNRCIRLYSPDPADLRAAAQALDDAQ